jgi:hypothetical protein
MCVGAYNCIYLLPVSFIYNTVNKILLFKIRLYRLLRTMLELYYFVTCSPCFC